MLAQCPKLFVFQIVAADADGLSPFKEEEGRKGSIESIGFALLPLFSSVPIASLWQFNRGKLKTRGGRSNKWTIFEGIGKLLPFASQPIERLRHFLLSHLEASRMNKKSSKVFFLGGEAEEKNFTRVWKTIFLPPFSFPDLFFSSTTFLTSLNEKGCGQ